jgi:predicted metal-dependent hydrolase
MLGEDLVFSVAASERDYVFQEGKLLHICSTDITDQEKLTKLFQKWWRKKSLEVLNQRVDYWYPIIEKYGIPKPIVFMRKMTTMWGSCSVKRSAVVFNFYLLKARVACIDYVVLHELTHFLYPNHSKQFYDFLSNYMPDWKERKKVLDQDVVHGL